VDGGIAAAFEAMGDRLPVLPFPEISLEVTRRFVCDLSESYGVGVVQLFQNIGKLSVLRRSACVDNIPKGCSLPRRRFRVESGNIKAGQVRCDVSIAALAFVPPS
jgi:hypothetical protein